MQLVNRLSVLAWLAALPIIGLTGEIQANEGEQGMCQQNVIEAVARQEIEYLRRAYAVATDKIGEDTLAAVAEGEAIYQQIFTPDVTFAVTGPETQPLSANGPKGWVEVVRGALGPIGATQHLIGSQIVTFESLEWNDQCEITSGTAKMQSYVQAWHDQTPKEVWLFIGTYFDDVVYRQGQGWQIEHMELRRVTGELRPSGAAVAATPF